MVLLANLLWSRYGRAFRAVRDDEIAASLAGIHVARTKVMAFAISAGCAGLGGALLALSTGVVNTGRVPADPVDPAAGRHGPRRHRDAHRHGLGRDPAGVPAAVVDLAVLGLQPGQRGNAYLATIIFGVVLIVAMMAAPNGIQGGLRWLWGQRPHLGGGGRGAATAVPAPRSTRA